MMNNYNSHPQTTPEGMIQMLSNKLCSQLLDGSLTDHKTYISGTCRGYYVTVNTAENGMYIINISAHSESDPGNAALRDFIESRKNVTNQIQSVNVSNNNASIVSTRTFLIKKVPAHLNEAIMPIIDFLESNRYVSGCMQCGTQMSDVDCYDINGSHRYLCSDCAVKIESALSDKKQDVLANKSNLIPGIVGALLGSMLGCLVYFLIWQLGYIAAIAGLITAVCTFKGYEMFGKVIDKKGVIVCVLVIIFSVFFANQIVWAYDAFKAYKDDGIGFFECFRYINDVVKLNELTGQYYGNLAMAYLMTLLGSYRNIVNAFKSSTGSFKVKKMKD